MPLSRIIAQASRGGRRWVLAIGTLVAMGSLLPAHGAELAPSNLSALVRAVAGPSPTGTEPARTQLRGRHTLAILPAGGEQPGVVLNALTAGSDKVQYRALGIGGKQIAHGTCAPGKETYVRLPAGSRCLLHVNAGRGLVTIRVVNAFAGLCASESSPARLVNTAARQHFLVPRGTQAFSLHLRGSATAPARVQLFTPAGKPAGAVTTTGQGEQELRAEVDRDDAGGVWSLAVEKASEGSFGEVSLWLGNEVPPFLAESPEALALSFIHYTAGGALYLGAPGKPAMLEATINVAPGEDRLIRAAMTRAGSNKAIWATKPSPFASGKVRIMLPEKIAPGSYDLKTALLQGPNTVTGTHVQRIVVAGGFAHLGQPHPLIELQPAAATEAPTDGAPLRAQLRVDPASLASLSLGVALFRPGQQQAAFRADLGTPEGPMVPVRTPEKATNGLYRLVASLSGPTGKVAATASTSIYLQGQRAFTAEPPPTPGKKAVLRHSQRQRGYVLFSRAYHEAFPPNYEPTHEDIGRPLTVWATPGEYEPATFGVYTLKPLKQARVEVGTLRRAGGGRIEASQVDVRLVRCWPQRTDWQSTSFRMVPELLEPAAKADLPDDRITQYWLTLQVPKGTPAGDYRGMVTFRAANAASSQLKFLLKVLPFTLARPAERTWGLYADSARWQHYSDAELERELRDIRAHGIDALHLSPLAHGTLRYAEGRLTVDFTPLSRLMAVCRRVGLRGPIVLDVQEVAGVIAKLRGGKPDDAETQRLAVVALSELAVRAAAEKWPPHYFHILDQADLRSPGAVASTQALLQALKQAGLSLSATAVDPQRVPAAIEPFLDACCYSLGFVLDGQSEALTTRLRASGKPFWWYGSGCYTFGRGEEGNIALNRYLAGVAFWRSGAASHWSWTFQRPRGDAYCDFDGDGKDACLTYPAPGKNVALPTIQWEAIREGIDDYAYLYTFQQMVANAKRSRHARVSTYAAQVEKEAQQRLDAVPKGMAPAQLTAYDTHTLRKWLCKYLGTLVNKQRAVGAR